MSTVSQVHPGSSSSYSLTSSQPFASCLSTAPTLPPLLSQAQTSLPGEAWTELRHQNNFTLNTMLVLSFVVTVITRVTTLRFSSQNPTSMTAASHVRETRPERVFLHSASHFPFFFCLVFFDDLVHEVPPNLPPLRTRQSRRSVYRFSLRCRCRHS